MAPVFDRDLALNTVLPLCSAAYDTTTIPAAWNLVAKIEPLDYGFIAISGSGELSINFRGTDQSKPDAEWWADFDFFPVKNYYGEGTVARGFQDVYSRVQQCVADAVASQKYGSLLIVGHSLGAASAVECAADMARSGARPRVYTVAGPRVGKRDFAAWFDSLVPDCFRIVNAWDPVPHQPSAILGFEHVGHGVLVNGGFTMDWHRAHSIPLSYVPGVAKLPPDHTQTPIAKVA